MAVTLRAESYLYFWYQEAMPASIIAFPTRKNSLTSVSSEWPFLREMAWANSAVWPGGNSDLGPSAQYSAVAFSWSVRLAASSMAMGRSAVE